MITFIRTWWMTIKTTEKPMPFTVKTIDMTKLRMILERRTTMIKIT